MSGRGLRWLAVSGLSAALCVNVAAAAVPPSEPANTPAVISPAPEISDPSDLLEYLMKIPDDEVDLLWVNLVLDRYVDPNIDIEKTYRQIEEMGRDIEKTLKPNASDMDKIAAIRTYIYEAGEWNDNKAFSYDFNNPRGRLAEHKTLDYYINNRRGNCVNMPLLFLALAGQIGIDMALTTAPNHVQIVYTDKKTGKVTNFETTSGAWPMDPEKLRKQMPWTDTAIESGLYMQTLNKKQMITIMADSMLQRLLVEDKNYREDIEVAIVALEAFTEYDTPLLHIFYSGQRVAQNDYFSKYQDFADIPKTELDQANSYLRMVEMAVKKLGALGFKAPESWSQPRQARLPQPINPAPSMIHPNYQQKPNPLMPSIPQPTFPVIPNPNPSVSPYLKH